MNIKELGRFCHKTRGVLNTPFTIGDYSYASDGYIIVRVKRLEGVALMDKEQNIKMVSELFSKVNKSVDNLPEFPCISRKCSSCNGTGHVAPCKECEGEGTLSFESKYHSYEVDCKGCCGDGYLMASSGDSCSQCNGEGQIVLYETVHCGSRKLNNQLLAKIKDLPEIKISHIGEPLSPCYFTFNGGDGYLMPTR